MTQALGRLLLMPNALDLGAEEVPLTDVLAGGVITQASKLLHWVVEDARSARAFASARRSASAAGASPGSGVSSVSGDMAWNGSRSRSSRSRR